MVEDQLTCESELPTAPYASPRGYRLCARPMGCVLLALGFPGAEAPCVEAFAVRPAGPLTWILIGEAPLSSADLAQREAALGGAVALVDLTHGRERLEISGPGAVRKLAAGVAVDLTASAFPVGASCQTLCGHIAVHLTRTGPECFELIVGRSIAHDLWRALAG